MHFFSAILSLMILFEAPKEPQIDFCDVYGAIYVAEFPERADVLVYEESSEAFARMIIYEENSQIMADKAGKWYFTDNPDFARYSVYFTERRGAADFSVYFTDFESLAGCSL